MIREVRDAAIVNTFAQQAREGETVVEWNRERGSPADWRLEHGELVER